MRITTIFFFIFLIGIFAVSIVKIHNYIENKKVASLAGNYATLMEGCLSVSSKFECISNLKILDEKAYQTFMTAFNKEE